MKLTESEKNAIAIMEQLIDKVSALGYEQEALKFGCHLDDLLDLLTCDEGVHDD